MKANVGGIDKILRIVVGATDPAWFGLVGLAVVATLFTTVGFVGYRRRDIA